MSDGETWEELWIGRGKVIAGLERQLAEAAETYIVALDVSEQTWRKQLAEVYQNHLPQMSALAGAIANERDENRQLKTELAEANAALAEAVKLLRLSWGHDGYVYRQQVADFLARIEALQQGSRR